MTKLPRKEPLVKQFYFDLDTPNGPSKEFQRHGYQLIGETTITLVHYQGDQSAAVDFCHRNSTKSSNHNLFRTLPSKMKEFEKPSAIDHANIVYKKEVGSLDCPPERYTRDYSLRQIHADVPKSVGRWVLEKLRARVYNPYSGVTYNQSEGLK